MIEKNISYPMFIKPSNSGSSVGINKAKNIEELENDIIEYIEYYNNRRIKSKLKGMSPVQYRKHSKLVA